ncbi:MAG: hypothetical protein KBS68_04515 [Clostridiales bacterium]|nr:hypothetical protein [Candidatus Crickella merdequi]
MRLIDADKLTGALNLWGCYKHENPKAYDTLMLYEILDAIEDQPTACDVDKVVEELKNARCPRSFECAEYRERAIDIVRRGGIDEEI